MAPTPKAFDEATEKFMVLGDQKWPVPDLAPRQLRKIRSALLEMNERYRKAAKSGSVSEAYVGLNDEDYERLVLRPIYYALTAACPDLTWEEFLDIKIKDRELMLAWFTVRTQSGLFTPSDAEEEKPAGEAQATEQGNSTGT